MARGQPTPADVQAALAPGRRHLVVWLVGRGCGDGAHRLGHQARRPSGPPLRVGPGGRALSSRGAGGGAGERDRGGSSCGTLYWRGAGHSAGPPLRGRGLCGRPDGSTVVSASADGTIKVSDARTGEERATLRGHTGSVDCCSVAPDGSFVISAIPDTTLRLWDLATGEDGAVIPLLGSLRCVALHPWLPRTACGDEGRNLYLLDLLGVAYGPIIVTAMERDGASRSSALSAGRLTHSTTPGQATSFTAPLQPAISSFG